MLLEIQKLLRECLEESTSLSLEQIYVCSVSPNTPKPNVCIVPLKGTITPDWRWEQVDGQKVQRKYEVSQPLSIEFNYSDKLLLSNDLNHFLIALPKYHEYHLDILIEPTEINYTFAEGVLGSHQAKLLITTTYGIRKEITTPIISGIEITHRLEK